MPSEESADGVRRIVGELYFANELYGEDMTELRKALKEAGFALNIDPLQDQATIYKREP